MDESSEEVFSICKMPKETFEMVAKLNIHVNGQPMCFGEKMKQVRKIYKNMTTEIIRTDVWKRLETSWEFINQGQEFKIFQFHCICFQFEEFF